jgi:hypothetical protein
MKTTLLICLLIVRAGCRLSRKGDADGPPGWKPVESAAGRFRALMPDPAIERQRTMKSPAGPVTDHQYLHAVPGEDLSYSITYADFSSQQLRRVSLEQIMAAGQNGIMKTYHGSVESERLMERDGRGGREIVIRVPGRGRFLLHYYTDNNRLYTLSMAVSSAALGSKEARTFFDSFQFTETKR